MLNPRLIAVAALMLASLVAARGEAVETVDLLRAAAGGGEAAIEACGLLASSSGLEIDGTSEIYRRRLRTALDERQPGGPTATSPTLACWGWAVLGNRVGVRAALRGRETTDAWARAALVLCGGDPAILAASHRRTAAESAALLRAANLLGLGETARAVAERDRALPGHLRGWSISLDPYDIEEAKPTMRMALGDAYSWLGAADAPSDLGAVLADARRITADHPSRPALGAVTLIIGMETLVDAPQLPEALRDAAAFHRQRLIQACHRARYIGYALIIPGDLYRKAVPGRFAPWSLVGALQPSGSVRDGMLAVVRRFADEARADGRGLNRVGMVLHECFGRPERLDDAFRDWAGSIASVVLAAAEPCPDDLAALRAFDELAPLRVGASLAAVAAPFETADAPRWADARRAVLASRPVPGFPTGRPAATRTVARIDAMSRDWPGAGASAAIVTWTTVLGPRDTAIRLRWDATVPARLCHPGGDLAIVPGNRPASVEIDLPAGGPVDIRIVAAIGRDASSVRLRWQRPGAKGWSAGDDRMPGGAPWTEAVHPVAELPDGRHVIAAATARPWDPAAITEAARCAYANGRNEEAWLHASHLVALPGIGPSQIADLADAIGAWPGSERVLDDPGLPPLVVTTAFLRAGRPDLAIAAGRRAATMEGVYRHSRDTREAVDLAVRLALDAGLHQEVLAWIPAFMADSEAQPADMSLGREPMEALREIVLAASAASGAFDAAAVLRRLTTEDPDSGGRRRVHPELELAVRRSGDAACIRELGGSGRPVYGSWPSILALVRAQVDAGNLDQAGRTLKSLEDGHLTRIPNGIDDLHGMLLVQAVRLWNGKDPTRPHPERRILDGAQLTPAMQLALDVIDGRTTVDAADALIRTKGLLDAILPVAIVAWRRDRAAIARNLVELVTDARSDPAIGARNLRSHLPGVDREQPSGF